MRPDGISGAAAGIRAEKGMDGTYGAKRRLLILMTSSSDLDRGRGLGGALMRQAAQLVEANAIFLVGDPDYYARYGFENAVEMGFTNASGVPSFIHYRSVFSAARGKKAERTGARKRAVRPPENPLL